ncbi:hypothetical protein [Desulfovibrio desulfuricans]|nr:hypothetical protein [Desulfovibrio desulfuricans]
MNIDSGSLRALLRPLARRRYLNIAALCFAAWCVGMGVAGQQARAASVADTAPAKEQTPANGQKAAPQSIPQTVPQTAQGADASAASAASATQEQPDSGNPVEVRELWTGSLYSSTYRVGVCFSAQGKVRGVVHLRLYNGKVDVYHIDGTVLNNEIEAHHSSGHKFKGRLVSADAVEGVISLKNGMNVRLEGKRTHDAPLAPEDCAPLPQ